MVRRNFIFKTIREVFEKYGYQPIETPAMENSETLMGKYGEEGDRLIFKILDSGDFMAPVKPEIMEEDFSPDITTSKGMNVAFSFFPQPPFFSLKVGKGKYQSKEERSKIIKGWLSSQPRLFDSKKTASQISEKALRYDLTVPFARYVVQHQNEITFPFKRYQIQPVWRADRPQKGRYREFFQCDADVIGSNSLLNEVELVQIIDEVFVKLKISIDIKINNRKILRGIIEELGINIVMEADVISALDKLDKIGTLKVKEELIAKGLSDDQAKDVIDFIDIKLANNKPSLTNLGDDVFSMFHNSESGRKGLSELHEVLKCFEYFGPQWLSETKKSAKFEGKLKLNGELTPDFFLARGLHYYTGAIFEVKANDVQMGSICGGGRYDNLTGIFGLPNISGVGISFGIDRIFDVMNELNLFESIGLTASITKVMLAHFGEEERNFCIGIGAQLRSAGINTEVYPDVTKKISKQFEYANKKQIPFVIVVGGDEMKTGELTLKNMSSGEQVKIKINEIIEKFK